jgi:microsomal dipeptidase-like Zn-dependent dipeptidase
MSETICTYGGPIMTDVRFRRQWKYEKDVLVRYHLPRFRKGRLGGLVIPVTSIDEAALLMAEIGESQGAILLARSPSRARQIIQAGAFAMILGVSFEAIGTNLEYLDLYTQLGMVMFHLALNTRNLYVDGVGERSPGGLSILGLHLVKRLTKLGVLVDVSHTSDTGIWNVLEVVQGPVLASHSNARAICDNPRNLPDDLAKAIIELGGLIALSTYPTLVSKREKPSLEDYLDHIDYLADLVGPSGLGIGADFVDFVYGTVIPKIRASDPTGIIYGEKEIVTDRLASIEDITHVAEGLRRRGYTHEAICGIMGDNFLQVWEAAQARCETSREKRTVQASIPALLSAG